MTMMMHFHAAFVHIFTASHHARALRSSSFVYSLLSQLSLDWRNRERAEEA